eukprot:2225269-Pyramimonas_sp.AAC.1
MRSLAFALWSAARWLGCLLILSAWGPLFGPLPLSPQGGAWAGDARPGSVAAEHGDAPLESFRQGPKAQAPPRLRAVASKSREYRLVF